MGAATERYQRPFALTREEQDEYSALSHQRAAHAQESGALSAEIAPVTVAGRRGDGGHRRGAYGREAPPRASGA
ncbi:hypothetical protein SVIOM74S_00304 [Streptomyces violarus]